MSQTYSPPPPPTSRTRQLLLAAWAVMTLGGLAFVFFLGTNVPWGDEWMSVPAVVNAEPLGPWLWEQHNEHRLPLTRAIYYGVFQVTHDFRAAMYAQVLLLSALSLGLMSLAARLRGRPEWCDAFFPVSLLHLGHWENFIMGYQLFFVIFTALATGIAVVAVRTTRETAFRSGVAAGVLLLLTMLTGAFGLALVPPVGLWLLYLAALVWREGWWRSLVLVGFVAVAAAYFVPYFDGYHRPAHHPPLNRDPVVVGRMTGIVLSLAVGVGVSGVWWAVAAAEVVLGVATVVVLLRRGAADRPAALGLVAVAAGVFAVALTIGAARGDWEYEKVKAWSRYSHLVWPLLGAAYLAWVKAGGKWVPVLLCAAALAALPTNTGTGVWIGHAAREQYRLIEADLRAGVPAEEIVRERFPDTPHAAVPEWGVRGIPLLRDAGVLPGGAEARPWPWWWIAPAAAALLLVLRWLWRLCRAVLAERARELFRLQHERFEEMLLKAAGATGLPRGLRWANCQISGDVLLVRDTSSGGILALVPVVIGFEPEEGSDMEENPAAREPRPATAVFAFHRGTWETNGRVVFNHTPEQTVAAFAPQFRVIPHGHH